MDNEIRHATEEDHETIKRIVKAAKIGLLTTVSDAGHLHSRPLAAQDVEFDGDLWFFTQDPSDKVRDIAGNAQVNVAFESGKGYLSIAGVAEVVHDRAKVDEYWSPMWPHGSPRGRTIRPSRSSRCTPSRRSTGRRTTRASSPRSRS